MTFWATLRHRSISQFKNGQITGHTYRMKRFITFGMGLYERASLKKWIPYGRSTAARLLAYDVHKASLCVLQAARSPLARLPLVRGLTALFPEEICGVRITLRCCCCAASSSLYLSLYLYLSLDVYPPDKFRTRAKGASARYLGQTEAFEWWVGPHTTRRSLRT